MVNSVREPSGVKGVVWNKRLCKWVVRAGKVGLGHYASKRLAVEVRTVADTEGVEAALRMWREQRETNEVEGKAKAVEHLKARRAALVAAQGHPYTMLYPHAAASLGETVRYKGQLFRCDRPLEVISGRAKVPIIVDVWASHCVTCGALYSFRLLPKRDGSPEPFWPVRRCETHKRMGARVNPAKMHRNAGAQP